MTGLSGEYVCDEATGRMSQIVIEFEFTGVCFELD